MVVMSKGNADAICPRFAAFDPLQPAQIADPFDILAQAREEQPVFFMDKYDLWVATRREDVLAIYKDMSTFSTGEAHQPMIPKPPSVIDRVGPDWNLPVDGNVNTIDPPDHLPLKRILVTEFQKAIKGLDVWIEARLDSLLDDVAHLGEADLVASLTWPLTVSTLAHLIGASDQDAARFKQWAENWFELTGSSELAPERAEACWMGFVDFEEYVIDLIKKRRASPQNDLVSVLVEAQRSGAVITDRQIVTNMIGLVAAGTDTTANSIAQMMYLLLNNPDQLREVRERPELRPQLIEEVLRLRGPVRGLIRVTTRDTVLGGVPITKGSRIYTHIGAASRDPATFDNPDELDLHRANAQKHTAFGAFTRLCLGAPLARLEMRKALDKILLRLPDLRLAPHQDHLRYSDSMIVPSVKSLRICWTPRIPMTSQTDVHHGDKATVAITNGDHAII